MTARVLLLVGAIIAYVLGFGLASTSLLIWLFGAPMDPILTLIVIGATGLPLIAVLVAGFRLSGRTSTGRVRWWVALLALIIVLAGWTAATIVISAFAAHR